MGHDDRGFGWFVDDIEDTNHVFVFDRLEKLGLLQEATSHGSVHRCRFVQRFDQNVLPRRDVFAGEDVWTTRESLSEPPDVAENDIGLLPARAL